MITPEGGFIHVARICEIIQLFKSSAGAALKQFSPQDELRGGLVKAGTFEIGLEPEVPKGKN